MPKLILGKTVIQNKIEVIESGYVNYWHYRKWSDGTAEAWASGMRKDVAGTGNYQLNQPTPPGVFVNNDNLTCLSDVSGNGDTSCHIMYSRATKDQTDTWFYASFAGTYFITYHLFGNWR